MSNRRPDYRNRIAEDRKRELLLNLSQCELVQKAKENASGWNGKRSGSRRRWLVARREFTKETKRAALKRSEKRCEAIGTAYGLEPRERCYGDLSNGVQFDHIIADSIGGEPTLENCAAVCFRCHRIKTAKVDTPRAAKTKRQADNHAGIRKQTHPNFQRPAGSRYDWSRGGRLVRGEA